MNNHSYFYFIQLGLQPWLNKVKAWADITGFDASFLKDVSLSASHP